ncbi:MAG: PilZ domain-containing protein, partial [Syntrophobacteria bacterium]
MLHDKEKRQRPRARVSWQVTIKSSQGDLSGETLNVTVDGALVLCREPLEPNDTIEMVMNVPALVSPLIIPARVIHSNICNPEDET